MPRSAALKTYREKRDFARTAEPAGKAKNKSGHRFVIQKHDARRLHFDFRLELDGVLKSWAVTRGPSLNPADKRLAVRTEDHPVEYGTFEGTIPKGQYGGGTVMLWDEGTWRPQADPHEGLKKGMLKFELDGKRLKGGFALVRLRDDSQGQARELAARQGAGPLRLRRQRPAAALDHERHHRSRSFPDCRGRPRPAGAQEVCDCRNSSHPSLRRW